MRFPVVSVAAVVLAAAGCATQDQLRQTEAQQGQAVQALRADASRSESGISDLRAEVKRTQDSVHALEVDLTDARARADAAKVQADGALSTSREFLANLLATREEQRRQLDQSGVAFADLRRKIADLDWRLQSQQRTLDQNAIVLSEGARRLSAVEAGLQEAARRASLLEAKAKSGQDADDGLTRQLIFVRKQVEDARLAISSESLLQMMREVEDMRRNTASMRGAIDELQKAQTDSAGQARNYYLDLDTRIQTLKQKNQELDGRIQALDQKVLAPAHEAEASAPAAPAATAPAVAQ
jgi:chromosome segregation ATPase